MGGNLLLRCISFDFGTYAFCPYSQVIQRQIQPERYWRVCFTVKRQYYLPDDLRRIAAVAYIPNKKSWAVPTTPTKSFAGRLKIMSLTTPEALAAKTAW